MSHIAPVDPSLVHAAFLEAFADYAMDASGVTEAGLLLRMQKNAVDYTASPGLYDGGRLVGFTLIGIDEWGGRRTAFDAGTGIVAAFRKQGWAKRMFDHALPDLQERGVERFALEVLQENEPAIKAYRKSGFEITRELRCYIARVEDLPDVGATEGTDLHDAIRGTVRIIEEEADWLPSFENRFSATDHLGGDHMIFRGAFDGGSCVGMLAYAPSLNWPITLLVKESHRRRGIGRALAADLRRLIPKSDERVVIQNVDGGDAGMQAFVEACGFEPLVDQFEMMREI